MTIASARWPRPGPPEQAVRLTAHALDGFRTSTVEPDPQVLADLQEAVRIAPDYAEAWGRLAAVYVERYKLARATNSEGLKVRARAAAATALALDPREPRALIALVQLSSIYRHWAAYEAQCRRLLPITDRHPLVLGSAAGRPLERPRAAAWRGERQAAHQPDRPYQYVLALWSAGRIEAAEDALAQVVRRFPEHPDVWRTRVAMLMFGGRPEQAVAPLRGRISHLLAVTHGTLATTLATAEAMASGSPADDTAAVRLGLEQLPRQRDTFATACHCAVLGDIDAASAILDGFFFARGRWAELTPRADGSEDERWTSPLVQPPASKLWADPRFARFTHDIGLRGYWDQTGTRPDYLRLI